MVSALFTVATGRNDSGFMMFGVAMVTGVDYLLITIIWQTERVTLGESEEVF